jgi:DNA-binding winged helix-turn-helix (wHTH) protein
LPNEISFGPFVLNLAQRRLWRNGARVALKPREAALLGLLAERRPHAIAKDELIEQLWGGAATDAALAQTVYRLRQKLEQFGGHDDVIRTIPGVGFQFAGDSPFESPSTSVAALSFEFPWYQEAVAQYRQRTRSSVLSAIQALEQLHALQPHFLPCIVTLARAYMVAGIRLFRSPQESYWMARRAVKLILDREPGSAEAYATLATLLLFYDGDREQAHRATEHALLLAPHSLFARKAAFWDRLSYGDFSGALAQADLMMRSMPASAQAAALLGTALYMARRYDDARRSFDMALELDPHNGTAIYYGASTCVAVEDFDRAEQLLSSSDDRSDVTCLTDGLRGILAVRRGDRVQYAEIVRRITSASIPTRLALSAIAVAQGHLTRASELIGQVTSTREPSQFLLSIDPLYAPLRLERAELSGPKCARCGNAVLAREVREAPEYSLCGAC